jgi:hypothetical protein
MNNDFNKKTANQYDGNGWSKYQLMVLQQLDDHNKILQNFNKELTDLKQTIAVSDMEMKMWKVQILKSIDEHDKSIDGVFYDDDGLSNRIEAIEKQLNIEEKTQTKLKSIWALYAAVFMFVVNVGLQLFELFMKR